MSLKCGLNVLPFTRTANRSAQTPYRLQRQQPRFRPLRPPPALRDTRPRRPSAQPILRSCGLRPRPPPPPRARPRPRPRPPRTQPGRALCHRGCCSPRRPRHACLVSGPASPSRFCHLSTPHSRAQTRGVRRHAVHSLPVSPDHARRLLGRTVLSGSAPPDRLLCRASVQGPTCCQPHASALLPPARALPSA